MDTLEVMEAGDQVHIECVQIQLGKWIEGCVPVWTTGSPCSCRLPQNSHLCVAKVASLWVLSSYNRTSFFLTPNFKFCLSREMHDEVLCALGLLCWESQDPSSELAETDLVTFSCSVWNLNAVGPHLGEYKVKLNTVEGRKSQYAKRFPLKKSCLKQCSPITKGTWGFDGRRGYTLGIGPSLSMFISGVHFWAYVNIKFQVQVQKKTLYRYIIMGNCLWRGLGCIVIITVFCLVYCQHYITQSYLRRGNILEKFPWCVWPIDISVGDFLYF